MKTQNYQTPQTEQVNFKSEVRFVCTQGTSDAPESKASAPRRAPEITKIP